MIAPKKCSGRHAARLRRDGITARLSCSFNFLATRVAEGVETAAQRGFLIAAGCKVAQGYFFGKPVQAAETGELLRRNLQFATV